MHLRKLFNNIRAKRPKRLCTSMLLLLCTILQAQFILNEPLTKVTRLEEYTKYVNTKNSIQSIDDLLAVENTLVFKQLTKADPKISFSSDNYWLQIHITNNTDEHYHYFLETGRATTRVADFYTIDTFGEVQEQKNGIEIPFFEKNIASRKNIFKVDLPANATVKAYLHLKSRGDILAPGLKLMNQQDVLTTTYKEQLFNGFFYGLLLLACVIYFFFYLGFKNRVFIWYSLYILFVGLLQFSLDGYFHQFITPSGGWFNNKALLLFAFLCVFFLLKYTQEFLDLNEKEKLIRKAYTLVTWFLVFPITVMLLIHNNEPFLYPLANSLAIITLILIVAILTFKIMHKVPVDIFFTIGISFLVFGFIVLELKGLNILPTNFFTDNSFKFGVALEVIFLSISMSNRIKHLRVDSAQNQKIALQKEKDLNELKNNFLSNLSHELRTPLNLIMGIASSLEENRDHNTLEDQARLIMESSNALLASISDITDFTAIENGEFKFNETNFDFHSLLNRIEKDITPRALKKGIELIYPNVKTLPRDLKGDKQKLKQILTNLLNNALKFTEKGSIEFCIFINQEENGKTWFKFYIKDTGIGINEEKVLTAFDSFTKHSFEDNRQFDGLGLGLYITKSCVDICEGNIQIKNNIDGGTTCTVDIPYKIIPQLQPVKTEITNVKILLVEDNQMNQILVQMFVKKWKNSELIIANNGEECLELLQDNTFDIILMDLQMPIMNGFEAIKHIKSGKMKGSIANIPIIVLSADNTQQSYHRAKSLGADDFMNKPVEEKDLNEKIQYWLRTKLSEVV